jgi:hypothetical protein
MFARLVDIVNRPTDCVLLLPLSSVEKLVLQGLLKHCDYTTGDKSFPKNETLRRYATASERAVRRALRELTAKRWIKVTAQATRYKPTTYQINIAAIVGHGEHVSRHLADPDSKNAQKRLHLPAK